MLRQVQSALKLDMHDQNFMDTLALLVREHSLATRLVFSMPRSMFRMSVSSITTVDLLTLRW